MKLASQHFSLRENCVDGSFWEPSSRSRICSQHFVGGEKSHPNSPAYILTIFPEKYYETQKNTKTVQLKAQNRFAKAMRRSQNPSVCRMEKTKLADVRTCNVPNENIDINPNSLDIIQPLEPRFRGTVVQNTADKGCGPTIQQTDKQVGPNSLDEND
ncbi:hypothetical protein PV325_007942 [Microctonus aethiopoides]|nr:hypothetical protein PV325_007942 [Microctonus aethiopoides]